MTDGGKEAIQDVSMGRQPSNAGCMYTMPQRLTVAGDATARSATSKIMFMRPDMAMISPLFKHSFLLSSSTCTGSHTSSCSHNVFDQVAMAVNNKTKHIQAPEQAPKASLSK